MSPAHEIIRRFEGLRLVPYRDSVGIWTIGYGHTRGVTATTAPITAFQAEAYLAADAKVAENAVLAALTSFVFNVGPGARGYKDGFVWLRNGENSSILRLLNAGQFPQAAQQFDRWVMAGGKPLAGLVTRRAAEKALFLKPISKEAA